MRRQSMNDVKIQEINLSITSEVPDSQIGGGACAGGICGGACGGAGCVGGSGGLFCGGGSGGGICGIGC